MSQGHSIERVPFLDGLRAISVLFVMLSHRNYISESLGKDKLGTLGVTVFFVISGFIITHLLLKEMKKDPDQRFSIINFYLRRCFRILPTLSVYIIFSLLLLTLIGIKFTFTDLMPPLFYYQNYALYLNLVNPRLPFDQLWSLSVEEHFYLFFPVLLFTFRKNLKKAVVFMALISLLIMLWRCYLVLHFNATGQHLVFATDCRMDAIFTGCIAAILFTMPRVQAFFARINTLHAFLIGFTLVFGIYFMSNLAAFHDSIFNMGKIRFSADNLIIASMIGGLVYGKRSAICEFLLENPVMCFIGQISYSLYLWHLVTYQYLVNLLDHVVVLSYPQKYVIAIIASFTFAFLSHLYIEKPFIALGKKVINARKKPALVEVSVEVQS